jgi:1,4-dihydroxy-2-naphthoate octaprenyltransferase
MTSAIRPIGLGLAARGDPLDAVAWARRAQDLGLDSLWIHDSYFERDPVTFAAAVAAALARDGGHLRVGLGAVNPFTRHPVVLAMTGSALDTLLPGRIIMGLGTGLPLRLGQMGIPYQPQAAVERLVETIQILRRLWAGERLPPAGPGLPPLQPMFPPPRRIPIVVAGYRRAMVRLAGELADGYLARPAESIPSLRGIVALLHQAAREAGRDPGEVPTAGYLLALADRSRRDALDRAKREPFVIYMLSVLSDLSLQRAGFSTDLRDRIAAAWKAEDYTTAARLIPDDLVASFVLCGTREEIAAGAAAYHERAGLELPILQPVLQADDQVEELLAAAVLYAHHPAVGAATREAAALPIPAVGPLPGPDDDGLHRGHPPVDGRVSPERRGRGPVYRPVRLAMLARRARRLAAGAWEIARPFAYTASLVPVAAGGALTVAHGSFQGAPFVAALLGALLLHTGTNIVNEIYDVRRGIDTIVSPRASHAIVAGRLSEGAAFRLAGLAFLLALLDGLWLVSLRGLPLALLGLAGLVGGWGYTAPPLAYKYRALGVPLVFVLMGPLMVLGTVYAVSGVWTADAVVLSIPVGLLVAAILHGNEWRDIAEDSRAGITTLSARLGRQWAHHGYLALVLGAYVTLGLAAGLRLLPPPTVLAILSLPWLARVLRAAELGASGQAWAIAMIDLQTARLHLAFGAFLVLGVLLSVILPS